MKNVLLAIAAVPTLAVLYTLTDHPAALFGLVMLLGVLSVARRGRRAAAQIDSMFNPAPRRWPVWPFVVLALAFAACRPTTPPRAPEPAQVLELDCGAPSCMVTEAGGATMIVVLE